MNLNLIAIDAVAACRRAISFGFDVHLLSLNL